MELELSTSVTNLIMGALGVIALIITLLTKTPHKSHKFLCIRTLSAFTLSSFLGYINHAFTQTDFETLLLWGLLYICMFECVRLCLLMIMDSRFESCRPRPGEKLIINVSGIILCVTALILRPINTIFSMLFFLAYASVMVVLCLYHSVILLFTGDMSSRLEALFVLIAFILTVPAIVFQYCKKGPVNVQLLWGFDHNGISHLILILSFLFFAVGVIASLNNYRTEKASNSQDA